MAPAPAGAWRARFSKWWLGSIWQRTWLRLAVQAGVCTLLIMCIFSAPAVWDLHTYDIVLANPVLVLVIAQLGLLFTVNTGLPVLKIGVEMVGGSLAGGAATWAVVYASYGIQGGSAQPGAAKAALYSVLGALLLCLGTACRFRWPQHLALAGVMFNLSLAVGLAVLYSATSGLHRFVLYWWWFIGLACLFMIAVGMLVLPLPVGWVVRKQLARALRQEGCVVEAIVQLMTAEDPTQGLPLGPAAAAAAAPAAGEAAAQQAGSGGGKGASSGGTAGVRGGQLFPDFMSLSEGADSWSAAANWPVTSGDEPSATPALLRRLWARAGHGRRSLGRGLSRLSQGLRGSRANLRETAAAAAAMGIHPDLYVAVEPIYAMSGPTAASMQAAFAHMRFTHFEIDVYRRTHAFPWLPFQRLLLLARTLLSSAMMMLYPLQAGKARLGASRQHAPQLLRVAAQLKACCQALAAVLRDNAPAAPAIEQLGRLEEAFWELQRAVGTAAVAAAAAHSDDVLASAETAADQHGSSGRAAEAAAVDSLDERAQQVQQAQQAQQPELVGGSEVLGAQDSLALHLSHSMLFACCTRVRSMYLLLPQLVARDQEGVDEAVCAHFAGAAAWDRVLHARACLAPAFASPRRSASGVFRRSQALWGGPSGSLARLPSSRSAAALDKLERPTVQVAERMGGSSGGGPPERGMGLVHQAFAAAERRTGFSRNQLSLGLQMAAAYCATMLLVFVPAANEALGGRAVWAVFIIVVVHEPLVGSVVWKCWLRFGGTLLAGLLGLGALYFSVLCNGLSFENEPPKFVAMTAALTLLTVPLAAGAARYGLHNAYFWIVSCLIMYTVALPGYAHTSPMPVLALWRLACTAIGLAIELAAALVVFPVTAREAAHATAAGALRSAADVADAAFRSVLPSRGGQPEAKGASAAVVSSGVGPSVLAAAPAAPAERQASGEQQQQQQHPGSPRLPPVAAPHAAVAVAGPAGWQGREVAQGAVLRRIHAPTMAAYGRLTQFRALLVPLRVEYHPFKRPARFPTRAGRHALRLCRRMLNVLTTFAIAMDAHHTESVPLLEPHATELQGLVAQLSEALRALGAMVAGSVSLESAARTVAALEQHASHLMLRVLLGGVPPGLSPTDTQQGLAFLAMLFNATSVARLLCLSLGAAFCAGDSEGQAAAAALLRYPARWAADDQLLALASELLSEALVSAEEVAAPGAAAGASPVAAAAGQGAPGPAERAPS